MFLHLIICDCLCLFTKLHKEDGWLYNSTIIITFKRINHSIKMINEIEEPIENSDKSKKPKPPHVVVKNTADYQRMKLEKLMKNPVRHS